MNDCKYVLVDMSVKSSKIKSRTDSSASAAPARDDCVEETSFKIHCQLAACYLCLIYFFRISWYFFSMVVVQHEQELLQAYANSTNMNEQRATIELCRAQLDEQQRAFDERLQQQHKQFDEKLRQLEESHRIEFSIVRRSASVQHLSSQPTTTTATSTSSRPSHQQHQQQQEHNANATIARLTSQNQQQQQQRKPAVTKNRASNSSSSSKPRSATKTKTTTTTATHLRNTNIDDAEISENEKDNNSHGDDDAGSIMDSVVLAPSVSTAKPATSSSIASSSSSSHRPPKRVRFS
jgi:hypothetical protein